MGMFDRAKDELAEHKDDAKSTIDKAGEKIKEKTPDKFDGKVDEFEKKAKDSVD